MTIHKCPDCGKAALRHVKLHLYGQVGKPNKWECFNCHYEEHDFTEQPEIIRYVVQEIPDHDSDID